jgi:hypothetical protein
MLTTADKITLQQTQVPVRPTLSPSNWLGEIMRQALLFPALHTFISVTVNNDDEQTAERFFIAVRAAAGRSAERRLPPEPCLSAPSATPAYRAGAVEVDG